jgi:hypothetical protein
LFFTIGADGRRSRTSGELRHLGASPLRQSFQGMTAHPSESGQLSSITALTGWPQRQSLEGTLRALPTKPWP